jgi:citrate lyase gamma subunit
LYSNELAAVQRSSLSQQDKAALEIQLQAQKQAADKQAANEEKKLKREQAQLR